MRRLLLSLVLIFNLTFSVQSVCGEKPDSLKTRYEKLFDQFIALTPNPEKSANVENLVIERDVSKFTLTKGKLYLCKPIDGRVCAAVYVGSGTFEYMPPSATEQEQLTRFVKDKKNSIKLELTGVLMIFADTTEKQLERRLGFSSGSVDGSASSPIGACLKYISRTQEKYFDSDLISPFVERRSTGLFFASIESNSNDPIFFKFDPQQDEEVQLLHPGLEYLSYHYPELINQFHRKEYYRQQVHPKYKYAWSPTEYSIDLSIADNLDASVRADMIVGIQHDSLRSLLFTLSPELKVDSIRRSDGAPIKFFQHDDNSDVWVECVQAFQPGEHYQLRWFYHGNILYRDENYSTITVRDEDDWYPAQFGWDTRSSFDVTYHYPNKYTLVGIGKNVSSSRGEDLTVARWTIPPTNGCIFNIGLFKKTDMENKNTSVSIYKAETGNRSVDDPRGHSDESVASDVLNSIAFFDTAYGFNPIDKFTGSEVFSYESRSYPGAIRLSAYTFFNPYFQRTFSHATDIDEEELAGFLRAHEVAHQWWGIGVRPANYHDAWLSEGFANFSALWYLQSVLGGNYSYFRMLSKWRGHILDNRKYLLGGGREAGPISLGYRTISRGTENDYDLIIYEKGGWILHMLRMMMIDQKTMNEDLFKTTMHDFYVAYSDSDVSTLDFERIAEKHYGKSLGWFFRDWYNGTGIPKYKFSYKISDAGAGKYKVSCRVAQEDVPEEFQMMVPLLVDFGDKRVVRLRYMISGPTTEFDLPLLPQKPEKITFNDLESVLCEVENVDWKDK